MSFIAKGCLVLTITMELTEEEARALSVLPSYGTEKFLNTFYENLGRHYLTPHEQGLKTLFRRIETQLPHILAKADAARKAFVE